MLARKPVDLLLVQMGAFFTGLPPQQNTNEKAFQPTPPPPKQKKKRKKGRPQMLGGKGLTSASFDQGGQPAGGHFWTPVPPAPSATYSRTPTMASVFLLASL